MRPMPNGDMPPLHPLPEDHDWHDDICPVCNTLAWGSNARGTYEGMVAREVAQATYELLEEMYEKGL